MIRAGGLLILAVLLPATAQAQNREWWWDAPFKAFSMPSESMEPSILPGFYMIANKRNASEIQRGGIAVFRKGKDIWVMRVIGLPGDRVAMIDGKARLNGKVVEYELAAPHTLMSGAKAVREAERLPGERSPHWVVQQRRTAQDNVFEVEVPLGRLYLLGDNRDNAADSRFSLAEGGLETVAVDQVYGVVDPAQIHPGNPQ